jgi:hypothetical protein
MQDRFEPEKENSITINLRLYLTNRSSDMLSSSNTFEGTSWYLIDKDKKLRKIKIL